MTTQSIRATGSFKLIEVSEELEFLFKTYKEIVNFLITYANEHKITSFFRLCKETYKMLREKYPQLKSQHIVTACRMATAIYRGYRKRKRRKKAKELPTLKRDVVWLHASLFRIDFKKKVLKLSLPSGRKEFHFCTADYHEKFKDWQVKEAQLFKNGKGVFVNVCFLKEVDIGEPKSCVGVDINENNVTLALPNGQFVQIITHEREIRTAYYVKRRKIQKKIRTGKRKIALLRKYGNRERNRIKDLYHKVANKIIEIAKPFGAIALEDLTHIQKSIKYTKEMNGRLHRWSFRQFQNIIAYKATLNGLEVVYIDPAHTSSLCPRCGEKLSSKGHRILKCKKCGLEANRDLIGSLNILLKALKMWGGSVHPESQPMKTGGWNFEATTVIDWFSEKPELACISSE